MKISCRAFLGKVLTVAVLAASWVGFSRGAEPEEGILFHASFDKFTTAADFARGARMPLKGSPGDLQLRMNPDVKGGTATDGNSLSLTNPEMLTYPMKGNFRPDRGTVSFWVKMANYTLADGQNFNVFLQAKTAGFTMLVYKYAPEPNTLNFWVNVGGSVTGGGQTYQRKAKVDWHEGEWHKVDVTWDSLSTGLYLDGAAANVQAFDSPENFPTEVSDDGWFTLNRCLGWRTGEGRTTDFDEFKIYNRKLSAREISDAFVKMRPDLAAKAVRPAIASEEPPRLFYQCLPDRKSLSVRLDAGAVPGGGNVKATLELVEKATGKSAVKAEVVFKDGETSVEFPFGDALREKTEYELVARVSGSQLVSKARFLVPDMTFARHRIARDHSVPEPWVSVRDEGNGVFSVLDRRYEFSKGIFPTQVIGKGTALLAEPPTLEIDGEAVVWEKPHVVTNADDCAVIAAKGRWRNLEFGGKARLWFDGFVETRFAIRAPKREGVAKIGAMKLKWKVASVASRYLLTPAFRPWNGDRFEGRWGLDHPDLQAVWLTGVDRGFLWWNESPANWVRSGGNDIHIVRDQDEAAVTVDIIARPVELKGEATYAMGWQGTPPREIDTRYRTFLNCREWKTNGDWSATGWGSQMCRSAPDNMLYSTSFIPERPRDFGPYLEEKRAQGKTCLSYGMPTHLCAMESPWDYFYASCRKIPGNSWEFREVVTKETIHVNPCCPHTVIGDYQLSNIEKLFKDYPQLGGLYFDISTVRSCGNTLHGHGGVDAFGQKYETSTALSLREYFLRLRKVCNRHGKLLHLHAHNRYFPFVHSFADACWPGEERYPDYIVNPKYYYQEEITPEEWEAHLSSRIFGTAFYYIVQNGRGVYLQGESVKDRLADYLGRDAVLGTYMLSYIYDFAMCEEFGNGEQPVTDIRAAVRPYALEKALFHGYWFDPVATAAKEIRVSAYTWKPGEGRSPFLIAAGNFGRTDKPMALKVDWAKLGARPKRLRDLVSGEFIPADDLETHLLKSHHFVLLVTADDDTVFIGTEGMGNVTPAATVPFGMVQPGPDTAESEKAYDFGVRHCGGYQHHDTWLWRFSQTHNSGMGTPAGGDIALLPLVGSGTGECARMDKATEAGAPGYYAVTLTNGIRCEVTATDRVSHYRFTFPKDEQAGLLFDLDWGMLMLEFSDEGMRFPPYERVVFGSDFRLDTPTEARGYRHAMNGCEYSVFFAAKFSSPVVGKKEVREGDGRRGGIWRLDFGRPKDGVVEISIALSFVSQTGARRNLAAEGGAFDAALRAATAKWNGWFARASLDPSTDPTIAANFRAALYHLAFQPNLASDVGEPDRYHNFSLWDTFRAAHPLYTILAPERVDGFVNSLLDEYDEQGFLPILSLYGKDIYCMVGHHSAPVIADAYLKGFRGFDAKKALEAMRRSYRVDHNPASLAGWGVTKDDWGLLDQYGYYPFDLLKKYTLHLLVECESVSRTLECSYDDSCVARYAAALGDADMAGFFHRRSNNWRNVFDPSVGYVRGKDSHGRWREPFDPARIGWACYAVRGNVSDLTEGNAYQYTWHVMQDPEGLVAALGGRKAAGEKLDRLFATEAGHGPDDRSYCVTGLIGQYAHGNEVSHHIAYFYAYTDRPWRTADVLRKVFATQYAPRPDGLCGNDDCGQMSAWYVFACLGFYPFDPCGGNYVFGAPQVPQIFVTVGNRKTLTIRAKNLSETAKYVKGVRLNGKPVSGISLKHEDLFRGGELLFEMGDSAE